MPVFRYTATDSSGYKRLGSVDARTDAAAVTLLKTQGLYVIDLIEKKPSLFDELLIFKGVPQTDVVNFTRQFATMISAGLPLSRALEVLADQTTNKSFKNVLLDVLRDVEGGVYLSSAFGRYPKVFSTTYRALVRAGESSGKLDVILKRLADTMEADRELTGKFKAAMVYPAIVFLAMMGVFVMMMVFVVPKLATLYKSLNVDLPGITKLMIAMSDFMINNSIMLVIATVIGFFALRYFLSTPIGKAYSSKLLYDSPVFGKINKQKDITQFTRTLSLLIGAAIPIVEALRIVSEVVGNGEFKEASIEASRSVEKGNSLSEFLKKTKVFPPIIGQMAAVGEETGKMDEILDKVASYFEAEVDYLVKGLSAALEPVILIMLGTMVAVLIISIITPIYKITSAL